MLDAGVNTTGSKTNGERPQSKGTINTVVIGGGQAGLAVGYHLLQRGIEFLILDSAERTGDTWRNRWDSLQVFTPARFDGLPGMRFPARKTVYPSKDDIAAYLASYAKHYDLPIQRGCRAEKLTKRNGRFIVSTGSQDIETHNVVVAMSSYQLPNVPEFAGELDPEIIQLHSKDYRNPSQLQDGGVLVVGASDSGCELAIEAAKTHQTWLSGRHPGHVPFRIDRSFGRQIGVPIVVGQVFHRLISVGNPLGRRVRPKMLGSVGPNVRIKPKDVLVAGVECVPKTKGVTDGKPLLVDGRVLDVANVIWCTGYRPDFSWIDLSVFGDDKYPKEPRHHRGVVADEPGLYFVGLFFLYSITSSFLLGVGRDAEYVVSVIESRAA